MTPISRALARLYAARPELAGNTSPQELAAAAHNVLEPEMVRHLSTASTETLRDALRQWYTYSAGQPANSQDDVRARQAAGATASRTGAVGVVGHQVHQLFEAKSDSQEVMVNPPWAQNVARESPPTEGLVSGLKRLFSPKPAPDRQAQKYHTFTMVKGQRKADAGASVHYYADPAHSEMEIIAGTNRMRFCNGKPLPAGTYMYFMDGEGRFYADRVYDDVAARYQHSTLPGGKQVACVGNVVFADDGLLDGIDRSSGHYKPPDEAFEQLKTEFRQRGFQMDDSKWHNRYDA